MVDPSPPNLLSDRKAQLRRIFRAMRTAHVGSLHPGMRALILSRPPAPLVERVPEGATVGLYYPLGAEAPSLGWARWLAENGRRIALPWFAGRGSAMQFRVWDNPFDETRLDPGPYRAPQPDAQAELVTPEFVIVPLIAFTAEGQRLGQGGGHYDRWLAEHPDTRAIGLGWDCQLTEELPLEPHDQPLEAVVTPTRIYEGAH
ncbi:5-formyltetrahydrofolate cyclo-ligase [Novosphingobium sp. YJ-S2-02]|uniref:5-formyltetrahydrofolate cyclo-ligase n=1 Tax=Novosphingobium aureum TaxID=2792964 RepID=A0A931HDX2_9SPHN|nr:5-formyltetrahydrofolate cyclo-ligase [Novosphingobium aureum]MBH0113658.1 5-formyltetrahydrofolate cyclo-ligase [Novosphingobium aureum]